MLDAIISMLYNADSSDLKPFLHNTQETVKEANDAFDATLEGLDKDKAFDISNAALDYAAACSADDFVRGFKFGMKLGIAVIQGCKADDTLLLLPRASRETKKLPPRPREQPLREARAWPLYPGPHPTRP